MCRKRFPRAATPMIFVALCAIIAIVPALQTSRGQGPADVAPDTAWNVQALGRLPIGSKSALAVRGDYAYLAIGDRLAVIDTSAPTTPVLRGCSAPLPGWGILDIVLSDAYAFLASDYAGLHVVDISDPTNAIEVGSYDTPGRATQVAIADTYAYIADQEGGLRIIDISDPSHLVETGFLYIGYSVADVAVLGNYAYVVEDGLVAVTGTRAFATGNLYIIDVSNPCAPREVGYLPLSRYFLSILDVSDPAHPEEVGQYHEYGYSDGISAADAEGDYVYLGVTHGNPFYDTGTLIVLDVANPSLPVRRGTYTTQGAITAVEFAGQHIYLADDENGLYVIEIANPDSLIPIGAYMTPAHIVDMIVHQNYLHVASGPSVVVLDVADRAKPKGIASSDYEQIGSGGPLAASGDYVFVVISQHLAEGKGQGMLVIDTSSPQYPKQVGRWRDWEALGEDIAIAGNYAYLANLYPSKLKIVDVSRPTQWWGFAVSYWDASGPAYGVDVKDGYAYVADGGYGLRVIDVSDPTRPTERGAFATLTDAHRVIVRDSYAYVGEREHIQIVDISDPVHPTETGRFELPGTAEHIALQQDYLYVADDTFGLQILNISDAAHPRLAGLFPMSGGAYHVAVQGESVYVAQGRWSSMLWVLRFPGEPGPSPTPTPTPVPRPTHRVILEAENGYIVRPGMDTGISTEASRCGFVETKLGNQGSVTLTFSIPSRGNYAIWARVKATGEYTGNSFFVSVDGRERFWHEFTASGTASPTWIWSRVHTYNRPVEERYYFDVGIHTIRFDGREMGAKLDQVLLTDDLAYSPGVQDVAPCALNTPSPTPTRTTLRPILPTPTPTRTATPTPSLTPTSTPTPAVSPLPTPWERAHLPVVARGAP